jgi:predicted MFS family arabinose efflux permease
MDEDVFFFPYIRQISGDTVVRNVNYDWYMFDDLLYDVSTGEYPQRELWESSLINLDPVTDDRPYFFNYNAGIPDVMAVPLWLALFIVGWFLFNWLRRWKSVTLTEHPGLNIRQRFCNLALIAFLLGFSYFFIQAYLFQILNLKLSSPSKSFSLLLFSFLLGNGLGSLLTKWFKRALTKKLMAYTAMIVIANLLTVLVLLPISYDQLSELGIAGFLLFPAFFIGIPFPLLLRMGAKISDKRTVALLLGISSVAGVAASILAIVISILYGYKAVFIIGLILYGIAAMVTFRLRKLQIQQHKHQFI